MSEGDSTGAQRFVGKAAVVTGAASGLGLDVARRLVREGVRAIALIDRDAAALARLAAEIGPAARAIPADVSDEAAMAAAFSRLADWNGIDVLITAAGILGPITDVASCAPADWDRVFAINVRGTYLALHHAVPRMVGRNAAIVCFSSTAGLAAAPTLGPYSASKGAIVMMTKSLAVHLATQGVRVNCVCPGSIETPMLEQNLAGGPDPAGRAAMYRARHPMNRFGRAEEVTEAVLFLASPQASYMTGVALPVDGGRLA